MKLNLPLLTIRPFSTTLLVILLVSRSCLAMMRTFGDTCGTGEPCLGNHVTCLASGVCGCASSDDMTYDQSTEACLTNLGKDCEKNSECIEGARCVSGVCKCDIGFYPSQTATICLSKKSYNESCLSDIECGLSRNRWGQAHHRPLKCMDGVCCCNKKDVFDHEKGLCVGLVESECPVDHEYEDCTSNAECRPTPNGLGKRSCQCGIGYAKNSHGQCGKSYGHFCRAEECSDIHFICIDGNCTCKYPVHQIYDDKTLECFSLVSGPCTYPKNAQMSLTGFRDFQKCVKNAHCVDKGYYSECECKPGFVQTQSGTCTPGYGRPCEPGDCDPDNLSGLFCRNGICDCLDLFQVYDPTIKSCRGLVGSRCTVDKPYCVEFASCVVPDPQLPGKCLCDKYAVETVNRTCAYRMTL